LNSGQRAKATTAARTVALLVIAVLGFHLSRFYLSIELCTHHTETGYAMEHCKDVSGWLTAPRVKMDEVPAVVISPVAELVQVIVTTPIDRTPDVSLPPPFHPPRFLS
jgi:hypothetical protein